MKRKTLALALAIVLGASLLAGCGGSSGGSAKPAETKAAEAAETEAAEGGEEAAEASGDKIEIEFWLAQGNNVMDLVNQEIDSFNESQDKYHVTAIQQENYVKTFSNLQAAIAGKTAPDVALLDTAPARQVSARHLM